MSKNNAAMRCFGVGPVWRVTAACALLLPAALAIAETAADVPAGGLEEIIVSAQRKQQTLQDVPVTVTFISPETAQTLDVRDLHQMSLITPNFSFSNQSDFAQIYIRGIGTNYANPGVESPVATYVDEVYQTGANNNNFDLFDLGNVQVLNGPQGTLYGRNASGGVILLNSANPTDKEEASISAEGGRFDHEQVDLMLNQPISADLKFRIAARYTSDGGFIHNEFNGKSLGGGQNSEIRGKLEWTPAAIPGLDVLLSNQYSYAHNHHDYSQERLAAPLCLGCNFPGVNPPNGYYDTNQNESGRFVEADNLSILKITYDNGPYNIKSISSYRKYHFNSDGSDQDYTAADLFRFQARAPGRTLAEDVTLQTAFDGPLNVIGGIAYIHDVRSFNSGFYGLAFAALEAGPFANTIPENLSQVVTDSYSGFLEATYKITKDLSFVVGGRENVDHRDLNTVNNPLASLVFANTGFHEQVTYRSFTPRYVLQYSTPVGDAYLSDTKGFKAGGLNTPAFEEAPPIAPEKIETQELGLKSRWLDSRLQTNVDVFHYKDEGLQVQVTDVAAGGSVTENAGAANGYGLEASARFAATDHLILGAGGDYLRARFTTYTTPTLYCPTPAGLVNCSYDISGTPLPHAPKYTGYATAEYDFPIAPGFKGALAAAGHYSDRYLFIAGAGGPLGFDQQHAFALVNINGWVTPDNESYRIGFYIDNATNRRYLDFATTAGPYGAYAQAAMPITYGAKFSYKFANW